MCEGDALFSRRFLGHLDGFWFILGMLSRGLWVRADRVYRKQAAGRDPKDPSNHQGPCGFHCCVSMDLCVLGAQ